MPQFRLEDDSGNSMVIEANEAPNDAVAKSLFEEHFPTGKSQSQPPTGNSQSPAELPPSLSLTPQFAPTQYEGLMQPKPDVGIPQGSTSDWNKPSYVPPEIIPAAGEDLGSGYKLPQYVERSAPNAGQVIERQGPMAQFIEETAQAPIKFGTMSKNALGKYETETGFVPVQTGNELDPRERTALALPLPSDWITEHMVPEGKLRDLSVGLRNAAVGFVNFFASPQGVALGGKLLSPTRALQLGATPKFIEALKMAQAGGDTTPLLNQLRTASGRAVSGAFSYDMAKHAPDSLDAGDRALRAGDIKGAAENYGSAVSSLVLATQAGRHAIEPTIESKVNSYLDQPGMPLQMPMEIEKGSPEELATRPGVPVGQEPAPAAEVPAAVPTPPRAPAPANVAARLAKSGAVEATSTYNGKNYEKRGGRWYDAATGRSIARGDITSDNATEYHQARLLNEIVNRSTEGGESSASEVSKAAEVHGDVRPPESEGQPEGVREDTAEGGKGVQPQAEERILEPLTTAETVRWRSLTQKFTSDMDMTPEEYRELDDLDARGRAQMVEGVTGENQTVHGRLGEASELIKQELAESGTDASNIEIGIPKANEEGLVKSGYYGTHIKGTGKIRLNIRAIATDMAKMPPSRRKAFVKAVVTEEWFHSHTGRADARAFYELSSPLEREIGRRIYLGKNAEGREISNEDLGYEMMRRRVQRLKGITISEAAHTAGLEHWTVRSLDLMDDLIAKARRTINTKSGRVRARAQMELLNKLQANIKAARKAVETGGVVRSPQRGDEEGPEVATLAPVSELNSKKNQFGDPFGTTYHATPEDYAAWQKLTPATFDNWGEREKIKNKYGGMPPEPPKEATGISQSVESKRRGGLTKKEEEAIETQRKYREAMGRKPVEEQPAPGPEAGAAPRKVPRSQRMAAAEFFAKPTPESITQTAHEVLGDQTKLPTFSRFLDHVRSKHGEIQPGQVTEAWVDSVNKFLESATGDQLNKLVDRLGLRRQVFGKIPQGSKTFGLKGGPPAMARTGDIADPTIDVGGIEIKRQRALDRAARMTTSAEKLEQQANSTKLKADSVRQRGNTAEADALDRDAATFRQKAMLKRAAASAQEHAGKTGEGIELETGSLFGGEEELRPEDYHDPVKGPMRKARDRAIAILGANLKQEGQNIEDELKRKEIGPGDIRWHEEGADIVNVTPEDLKDLDELGMRLTAKAGSDATTKKIRGGGQFVIREKSMPRSHTKRVVTLRDKKTGKIYMVDGYRDSKRGPVFLDPHSVTGEHRTLEQLISRFDPVASFPLDKPVKDFFWQFKDQADYDNRFGTRVNEMEKEVGYKGFEGDVPLEEALKHIEGSEAVEGEGGFVQGPHAMITRATLGMVDGARDMGIDITPNEARHLYRAFRFMETGSDAEALIARLRRRAEIGRLRPEDHLLISAISKVNDAISEEGYRSPDDVLNEIYALTQRIEKESAFAKSVPSQYAQELRVPDAPEQAQGQERAGQELTMPLNRVPPTLVRPEQLPAYAPEIQRRPAPPSNVVGGGLARPPADLPVELGLNKEALTDYAAIFGEPPDLKTKEGRRKVVQFMQSRPAIGLRTGGKRAEFSPMAETPGPREEYKPRAEKKIEFTPEELEKWRAQQDKTNETANKLVTDVAKAVTADEAQGTMPLEGSAAEAEPLNLPRDEGRTEKNQGELFALRRMSQQPDFFTTDKWKSTEEYINKDLKLIGKKMATADPTELADMKLRLSGWNHTIRTIIRDTGLQLDIEGDPLWETVRNGLETQASYFLEKLQMAEALERSFPEAAQQEIGGLPEDTTTGISQSGQPKAKRPIKEKIDPDRNQEKLLSLRRRPPTSVMEAFSNLLNDTGSVYDRWLTERIDEYGGTKSRRAASGFRHMISREKELYGGLTPLLDRARRLAGGNDPGRGGTWKQELQQIPGRLKGTANALRATAWLNRIRQIDEYTGTAHMVDALEGNIPVPDYAKDVVDAGDASNREIGALYESVIPDFLAGGKVQRNLTGLGYDTVRAGGGDLWLRWTKGLAEANRLQGKSTFQVRQDFKKWKAILDDPMASDMTVEKVNQDMAREYPNVVSHVKQFGRWMPMIHSDLFNYLENAARRATHVVAFREQFPHTDEGKAAFKALMEEIRTELPSQVQDDLEDLIRSLHGHPTDDLNTKWGRRIGMAPHQPLGAAFRGVNATVGNVMAKAVLTGQMFTQTPETLIGSTAMFLGYKNYLKGLAQAKMLYSEMEARGSVNRVMNDYSINLHQPGRTAARLVGNALTKLSAQNFLNEIQEAAAAATARVVSEKIITGNLTAWEKSRLPHTFSMMGFSEADVAEMMRGDTQLLDQFQRKAAAWLTGGNKSVAEGSGLSTSRLFGTLMRFQTYPMMKANQFRRLAVNWADAVDSKDGKRIWQASTMMGRFMFGNALQGAMVTALVSLAYGGLPGFRIKKKEAQDEPWLFLGESMASAMSGPLYLLWRGARQGGVRGVGDQATRLVFPYAIATDMMDMAQGQGIYRDTDLHIRIGRFLANKTPATRAIATGLAMFGLGNPSQALDQSISGLHRWQMSALDMKPGDFPTNEENAQFRTHVRAALNAIKDGDEEKYINEWMKALDVSSYDKVSQSLRSRKVLKGPGGRKLTEEEVTALSKHIGLEAYERLESWDAILEAAANGSVPPPVPDKTPTLRQEFRRISRPSARGSQQPQTALP